VHALPSSQPAQEPPQSRPDSSPLRTPSVQLGAMQIRPMQTLEAQSDEISQRPSTAQRAAQVGPPQSTPVSSPLRRPSEQLVGMGPPSGIEASGSIGPPSVSIVPPSPASVPPASGGGIPESGLVDASIPPESTIAIGRSSSPHAASATPTSTHTSFVFTRSPSRDRRRRRCVVAQLDERTHSPSLRTAHPGPSISWSAHLASTGGAVARDRAM